MIKKQPKVSIAMLARNCERFLAEAISSVLSQTFTDWELLIIDDYSADKTSYIAEKFVEKDNRIKYFLNEKSLGIPKSRNRALKLAQGEYFAVLDGDDVWLDNGKLYKQVKFLDDNVDCGVVGTSSINIDANSIPVSEKKVKTKDKIIRYYMPFRSQIINSSSVSRISLVRKVGGYDNTFQQSQDYNLWLNIAKISKLRNLEEKMIGYRIHGDNVSIRSRQQQLRHSMRALKMNPDFTLGIIIFIAYWSKYAYVNFLSLKEFFNKK